MAIASAKSGVLLGLIDAFRVRHLMVRNISINAPHDGIVTATIEVIVEDCHLKAMADGELMDKIEGPSPAQGSAFGRHAITTATRLPDAH